jgi:arginine/ornithine N-succinyltransferase beta subunit
MPTLPSSRICLQSLVIDFVNVMPGTPKSKVKSRIIFTPQHAKRFMKAMIENINRYEAANGVSKTWKRFKFL